MLIFYIKKSRKNMRKRENFANDTETSFMLFEPYNFQPKNEKAAKRERKIENNNTTLYL